MLTLDRTDGMHNGSRIESSFFLLLKEIYKLNFMFLNGTFPLKKRRTLSDDEAPKSLMNDDAAYNRLHLM